MKKISIVIVNYNVEFFLEQCLKSVYEALDGIEAEVFVVDNNSVDHSVDMVRDKFPDVKLIANNDNKGFSRANNQAIEQASGEYILLLNPDTLVQKETFRKTIEFMDAHPEAGGLGVQMIDGKGHFLAESKRGLPTPWVAFYKIFGFTRFFPRSKKFGKYHLTYLDRNENHEVDVLSGAFMMLRKSVIDQIGPLDEAFFMYGEDIDLSYRITQAGFKNYYFAQTRIIHYKGESTKKGSLNYVLTFYNAMKIFAEKHYSAGKLRAFLFFIRLAIFLRASLAIVHRFFKSILLPLSDFFILAGGFYAITHYWQKYIIFPDGGSYPHLLVYIALPSYVLVWMFTSYLSGLYDKSVKFENLFKGVLSGTIVILLVYSLLDDSMRFSRALILLGTAWVFIAYFLSRMIFRKLDFGRNVLEKKKFVIVGNNNEPERVKDILVNSSAGTPAFIGFVSTSSEKPHNEHFIGVLSQLEEIIRIYRIQEVIFCSKDLSAAEIIDKMADLKHYGLDMKIAPADSIFIIGSNSINAAGDVYIMNINNIDKPENRRNKRTLDVLLSLLFLTLYPLLLWFVKNPFKWLANILFVIFGKKSWVGFGENQATGKLPKIRKGILSPIDQIADLVQLDQDTLHNLNIMYARDYSISKDILIILKGFKKLGK